MTHGVRVKKGLLTTPDDPDDIKDATELSHHKSKWPPKPKGPNAVWVADTAGFGEYVEEGLLRLNPDCMSAFSVGILNATSLECSATIAGKDQQMSVECREDFLLMSSIHEWPVISGELMSKQSEVASIRQFVRSTVSRFLSKRALPLLGVWFHTTKDRCKLLLIQKETHHGIEVIVPYESSKFVTRRVAFLKMVEHLAASVTLRAEADVVIFFPDRPLPHATAAAIGSKEYAHQLATIYEPYANVLLASSA